MKPRRIIRGQRMKPAKIPFAKLLRREMTSEERCLWENLRANRLKGAHFRRQQILFGYIVDFYCHAHALVVEVDGESHFYKEAADKKRDAVLRAKGFRILRVTAADVRGCVGEVLERIERYLTPHPFPTREGGLTENGET